MIQIEPILLTDKAINYYKDNPISYVKEVVGATPDNIQGDILNSVKDNQLTSVRSGHGIGKSALESWLVKWYLYSRPFPKIPCTAPTKHQLFDILWAEISKWNRQSADGEIFEWTAERIYHKAHPEEWFAVARTASNPDALQGFHADNILYIIDEASGVKDIIFEPVLGALSTKDSKLLMCGNPTQLSGFFFDSHNKNRHMYSVFKVSGEDSIRVSEDYIKMIIEMYGKDSDVYRVRVAGEFPKSQPDSFIPLDWTERNSSKTIPIIQVKEIDIGVDVARFGDDESAICPVFNKSTNGVQQKPLIFRHNDTMQLTGETVKLCKQLHNKYSNMKIKVKIDCDGLGVGVYDRLKEIVKEERLSYIIPVECHFGGKGGKLKTDDPVEMSNSTGLMWGAIREKLRTDTLTLWYNDKQISQLSNRKYKINSKGQLQLERKEDMKKRGLQSPDLGDALGLAMYEKNNKIEFLK